MNRHNTRYVPGTPADLARMTAKTWWRGHLKRCAIPLCYQRGRVVVMVPRASEPIMLFGTRQSVALMFPDETGRVVLCGRHTDVPMPAIIRRHRVIR